MGAPGASYDNEEFAAATGAGLLNIETIEKAVNEGLISEERLEQACRRILRSKFELGLFENPYSDPAAALALSASAEYIAQPWEIVDNDTLMAARNPEEVELERQLQAKSAVLVKNDDNLLPLAGDLKVYVDSTGAAVNLAGYKQYFGEYATVVDSIEEADVVVGDFTSFNDAAELLVDDAKFYGKKLVIVANCVDPTTWAIENADALIYMSFSRTADHGTGAGGFITSTEPSVYAEILYGIRQPEGMIVKELARDSLMDDAQWKDLAGDQGASSYVRLMLLAMMKTSPTYSTPENWGDALLDYKYGMRYGSDPEFVYDTLVLPKVTTEIVTESNGSTMTSYESAPGVTAGVPFTVYTLLWNNGGDGITTVEAYDGETLIAQKIMAVNGGSWRVVEMTLVLDTAGEHTITVGDLTSTITVSEAE
jgi:hypothetical protein